MKRAEHFEFLYQLFALILSIIVVHTVYVAMIRPNAESILQEQLDRQAAGEGYVDQRSWYVVLKDYEQESCFILFLWASAIMGFKAKRALEERKMLQRALLPVAEGSSILPEDAREMSRPVQALPESERSLLIPRTFLTALHRFGSTRSIADVAQSVKEICTNESERLDSELAMVRYIAWAIPSIGFIGTVRGIGEALAHAHRAVEGDIAGVTVSLGVAFNSTFIALVIGIVLMFFSHQLQLLQEKTVLDTQHYLDEKLIRHLRVREQVQVA